MFAQLNFSRDFLRDNPSLKVEFKPMTFQRTSSCQDIAFLKVICISPICHIAPIVIFET